MGYFIISNFDFAAPKNSYNEWQLSDLHTFFLWNSSYTCSRENVFLKIDTICHNITSMTNNTIVLGHKLHEISIKRYYTDCGINLAKTEYKFQKCK